MNITRLFALALATMFFAVACGSDSDGPEAASSSASIAETTTSDTDDSDTSNGDAAAQDERIETLWVGPQLVDCVGEAPQKCLQIKRAADGQVEWFYSSIAGFTHEVGTSYVIKVAVTEIADPPADASSLSYKLVEIVQSSTTDTAADLANTGWALTGFRDGQLFDPIPSEVTITLVFDGDMVNGSAGCNSYMGSFTASGSELTFGPLGATKKLCPPEIMEQEDRYLPLLGTVESAEVTFDGMLVLSPPSGPTLVFAPEQ